MKYDIEDYNLIYIDVKNKILIMYNDDNKEELVKCPLFNRLPEDKRKIRSAQARESLICYQTFFRDFLK